MAAPESLVLMIQDVVYNKLKRKRNKLMEDDKDMTVPEGPFVLVIDDVVYNELKRKRKRLMEDDYWLNEFGAEREEFRDEIDIYFPDLYHFIPTQDITEEDIRQARPDFSDDSLCMEMWLTYCKDLALEDTLRGLKHDHCYSNTSQYNGLVGLPKSSVNNNVMTSNTITKSSPSLYLMGSEDETESNDMDCDTFNQTSSSYAIESSDDCDTLKQTSSSCRIESPYMTDSNIACAHTLYQTLSSSAIDSTDVTESYIMDFDAVSQITAILEELVYELFYRLPHDIRTEPHFARYLIKSSDGTESYDLDCDKFFQESFSKDYTTQDLLDVLLNEVNKKVSSSHMDSGDTPIEDLCDSPTKFLN